jgi:hypothetical protein
VRLRVALACLCAAAVASAAPPARKAPPKPPVKPPAPLPMLPSIARVKVALRDKQVVVTEEVNLPRGDWKGEPLDLYVAFGAPGAPRAIDAHLVPVGDGSLEPEEDDAGAVMPVERAPRRPASANPLLGRDAMAGVVVHLSKDALDRAFAPGNMASLRLRTALDVPEDDPEGGKSLLVRLGASRGTPLTLGRLVLEGPSSRAEARLCGPEADPHPLAIAVAPRRAQAQPASPAPQGGEPRIAPVLAVRHASDDLCVRFWP